MKNMTFLHWTAILVGIALLAIWVIARRRRLRFNIESRANGLSINKGEGSYEDPRYKVIREAWYNPFSRALGIRIKLPPGRIIETFVKHSKAYSDIFGIKLGAPTESKGGWYIVPRVDFDDKKKDL